ncbi:phosphotransferase family protein [Pelomicrobium sp. G1]|uniref:phosphotransferase family protein n=1 Tax=unclassified Pelomicrobium TaxID=2815318 RepID=UPI003F762006
MHPDAPLRAAPSQDAIHAALVRMGLMGPGERPPLVPLGGGVSSDIYRVDLPAGPACIKRALPRLKTAAEWLAPVERNRWEYEWMQVAAKIVPEAVPQLFGRDEESGAFAMEYLDPAIHPVWKAQLRDGVIEETTAREVARRLVAIHAATAGDGEIARRFATDHIFFPIRLEPYLVATAQRHPDIGCALTELAEATAVTRRTLVHGDVSPKNILVGPKGPVFLDAECAWYGDPAFDLAFCLNHLLLKCLWRRKWRDRYLACFDALADAYLRGVTWEPRSELESRAAQLLPALFLARVDGKSPVEYVTEERDKARVRRVARSFFFRPARRLREIRDAWTAELAPGRANFSIRAEEQAGCDFNPAPPPDRS